MTLTKPHPLNKLSPIGQNSKQGQFIIKRMSITNNLKQYQPLPPKEKVQKIIDQIYYEKIFCNEKIQNKIFSFLEVRDLSQIASVNIQLRMKVKYFFIEYQANITHLNEAIISKNLIYSTFLTHVEKKFKIQKNFNKITVAQLQKLDNDDIFKQQFNILYCGLKANGHILASQKEVIPTIKKIGIKNCFPDIFILNNPQVGSFIQDISIPNFKKNNILSDELNQLLEIIAETILFKKIYNAQVVYQRTQQQILKYLNKKEFDKIKKVVCERIQPLNFRQNSSAIKYINKNNFSIILSFLSTKDILQLKYASKSINNMVNISLIQVVDFYQTKKELTMEIFQYNQSDLQTTFIYVNYFILEYIMNKIIDKNKASSKKVNQIKHIISDLIYEHEYNSSDTKLNENESILNHLKLAHDDFNKIFYEDSKSSETEQLETIQSFQSQIDIILSDYQKIIQDQIVIDYIGHFHQLQKRVAIYKKLINQKSIIPLIYKTSKYNELQFEKAQEEEKEED